MEEEPELWLFECHAEVKPLSINKAWIRNRSRKTKAYLDFQHELMLYLQDTECPEHVRRNDCKLEAELEFGFSNKNSDVDNCIKTTLDTLQSWFGFNDKIIYRLKASKVNVKRGEDYLKIKLQEYK